MTIVIILYVCPTVRLVCGVVFIATSWWAKSWAWYTTTSLLLADNVVTMSFLTHSKSGIPLGAFLLPDTARFRTYWQFRLPSWILDTVLVIVGLVMQYLWTDWPLDLEDAEVRIHTRL